jgi:enoyl-CoA hydratase
MAAGSEDLSSLRIEITEPIGRIVFNRPEKLNALDERVYNPGGEFSQALDILEASPGVRVIILKGAGRAFCVGGDFSGTHGGKNVAPADDIAWMEGINEQSARLWRSPKPTIAQVHGYCIASGLIFAMGCDLIFAAEDARLGEPAARSIGLPPDLARWPLLIGIRRMKELLYTGDTVTGAEAAAMGLVNTAVPADELEAYVEWVAGRIALVDPDLIGLYKRAANDVAEAAGLKYSIGLGSAYQALAHRVPERQKFWTRVEAEGPKAAFSARDDRFGGAVPRSILWEQKKEA